MFDREEYYIKLKKMIDKAEEYYKYNPGELEESKKENLEKAKKQYKKLGRYNTESIIWRDKTDNIKTKEYRISSSKIIEIFGITQKYSKKTSKEYYRQYRRKNQEKLKSIEIQSGTTISEMEEIKNNKLRKKIEEKWRLIKLKRKTDLKFNLNARIRSAIRLSLKGNKPIGHWEYFVEYTLNDLIKRLEETMPKGYTWQNLLIGELHVDHIIPISAFNFIKPEHTDFKRCWALSNLRLLPAKENLIKGDKLDRPFQPALKI